MEIVLATGNLHKVKEIKDILKGLDIKFLTLQDFPKMPDIVEDGKTFEENAVKRQRRLQGLQARLLYQMTPALRQRL